MGAGSLQLVTVIMLSISIVGRRKEQALSDSDRMLGCGVEYFKGWIFEEFSLESVVYLFHALDEFLQFTREAFCT